MSATCNQRSSILAVLQQQLHCTKNEVFIEDFFNKCDEIRIFLRIWSHLLKKSFMKIFIFCAILSLHFILIIMVEILALSLHNHTTKSLIVTTMDIDYQDILQKMRAWLQFQKKRFQIIIKTPKKTEAGVKLYKTQQKCIIWYGENLLCTNTSHYI